MNSPLPNVDASLQDSLAYVWRIFKHSLNANYSLAYLTTTALTSSELFKLLNHSRTYWLLQTRCSYVSSTPQHPGEDFKIFDLFFFFFSPRKQLKWKVPERRGYRVKGDIASAHWLVGKLCVTCGSAAEVGTDTLLTSVCGRCFNESWLLCGNLIITSSLLRAFIELS